MDDLEIQKANIFVEQGIHLLIFLVALLYSLFDRKIPLRKSYSVHPSFFLFILGFLVYELVRIKEEIQSLNLNEWVYGVLLIVFVFIFYLFAAYRNIYKKFDRLEKLKLTEKEKSESPPA